MSEIKSLAKRLLKKKPNVVTTEGGYMAYDVLTLAGYNNKDIYYTISLKKPDIVGGFKLAIDINSEDLSYSYVCDLTEQEFMEAKWQIEEWDEHLRNDLFDTLRDFVHVGNDPADDLLNDDE